MTQTVAPVNRWDERRRRAGELQERYPFASGVLSFYARVVEVQQRAFFAAERDSPKPSEAVAYAVEAVLPNVIELSTASGPPPLAGAVVERFHEADMHDVIARWLRGDDLDGVDRFMARAAAMPVLQALGAGAAQACTGPKNDRRCPLCGGIPQLSFFAPAPEDLVTGRRYLECSRCESVWTFARITCAYCGETESSRLQFFDEVEHALFPHMRIDACATCSRYLLTVDLGRDRRAVAQADEIAAIPLDIYAKELGLKKTVPNIVGF